jgi:major type 1 subunit fimbrin (pilin)
MELSMNKYLKIGLFTILAGAGSAAAAEDGTITFDGTISDATCIITGGDAQGESTSPDFTVHLPSVSTTALATAGQRAGHAILH